LHVPARGDEIALIDDVDGGFAARADRRRGGGAPAVVADCDRAIVVRSSDGIARVAARGGGIGRWRLSREESERECPIAGRSR